MSTTTQRPAHQTPEYLLELILRGGCLRVLGVDMSPATAGVILTNSMKKIMGAAWDRIERHLLKKYGLQPEIVLSHHHRAVVLTAYSVRDVPLEETLSQFRAATDYLNGQIGDVVAAAQESMDFDADGNGPSSDQSNGANDSNSSNNANESDGSNCGRLYRGFKPLVGRNSYTGKVSTLRPEDGKAVLKVNSKKALSFKIAGELITELLLAMVHGDERAVIVEVDTATADAEPEFVSCQPLLCGQVVADLNHTR